MVALLSEIWRFIAYLLRPEDTVEGAGPAQEGTTEATALAGLAKALLWAGLAVLAGFGLARLSG